MEGKRILVVEDDELNMKLVGDVLKLAHYALLEATDAETGIQLAREQHPDLILMDIHLPGMDGLTATRLIREDKDLRDIPVVALTSYAMEGDEEKAYAAGCAGYLPKPIDTRSFLESVSKFIKTGGT